MTITFDKSRLLLIVGCAIIAFAVLGLIALNIMQAKQNAQLKMQLREKPAVKLVLVTPTATPTAALTTKPAEKLK